MKKHAKNIVIVVLSLAVVLLSVLLGITRAQLDKNEFNNMEIERKFLVDVNHLPESIKTCDVFEMVQTYINYSPEMRVRKINNLYHFLTIKLPKDNIGLAREETEYAVTVEQYEELLAKQVGNTIYKTRYELYENNIKIEVDIYSDSLAGLAVAEVEFENVKKSEAFSPPSWFGLEVTSDSRYKNANLARYGMPVS